MRCVVDSSVGFKWPVIENNTDKARKLRDDFCAGTLELLTPDIFAVEIAHALTRAERQARITPLQGAQFIKVAFLVALIDLTFIVWNSLNCSSTSDRLYLGNHHPLFPLF